MKVRSYIYSMEKLINKADVFGTVGPFNINGQKVEMDYVWEDEYQEAKTIGFRFDGKLVAIGSVAEWIHETMFQEVPYDELENQ